MSEHRPAAANRDILAGLVLMTAAAAALIISNTPLAALYDTIFAHPLTLGAGEFSIQKPSLLWINDGLMAIFFLLVGLEIKKEVLEGELSSPRKASLPLLAAVGGMAGPVLIFWAINQSSPATINGWAIPAATDIAFALGILMMLGSRIPAALKILLLAIAIIDDLGAITLIALFYSDSLSMVSLGLAAVCLSGLILMNRAGMTRLLPYLLVGAIMWVCVLKSGLHATLAGVLLAMAIPLKKGDARPLDTLEHAIQPYVAFLILPIFAFANSGITLTSLSLEDVISPLTLGIAAGLFFGKQIGVFGAMIIAVKTRLSPRPDGVSWAQLYGLACLTGVGFTMSLFIGGLAFDDARLMDQVRVGVIAGSLASAGMAIAFLTRQPAKRTERAASRARPAAALANFSARENEDRTHA